jgi:hypothetical protein
MLEGSPVGKEARRDVAWKLCSFPLRKLAPAPTCTVLLVCITFMCACCGGMQHRMMLWHAAGHALGATRISAGLALEREERAATLCGQGRRSPDATKRLQRL